jgi:hypothetical protein
VIRAALLALVFAVGGGAGSPAHLATPAPPTLPNPNLESLLPGLSVPADVQPHGVPHCLHASLACLDNLIARLRAQWRALDAGCDHRAVFSLAYLRITEGLRETILQHKLRWPHWMEYVITDFSNRYLSTFHDFAAGRPVPYSWKVAYQQDLSGNANAGQDSLLASNAHTQHDLPYIYAEMGIATRSGTSRKPDHDVVNAINDAVFGGLERYYAAHYDPVFSLFLSTPLGLEKIGVLQVVQVWRELAWRNAELLMSARTPLARWLVGQEIDANANAWATLIASADIPGYRASRDAFCRAHRTARGHA